MSAFLVRQIKDNYSNFKNFEQSRTRMSSEQKSNTAVSEVYPPKGRFELLHNIVAGPDSSLCVGTAQLEKSGEASDTSST